MESRAKHLKIFENFQDNFWFAPIILEYKKSDRATVKTQAAIFDKLRLLEHFRLVHDCMYVYVIVCTDWYMIMYRTSLDQSEKIKLGQVWPLAFIKPLIIVGICCWLALFSDFFNPETLLLYLHHNWSYRRSIEKHHLELYVIHSPDECALVPSRLSDPFRKITN